MCTVRLFAHFCSIEVLFFRFSNNNINAHAYITLLFFCSAPFFLIFLFVSSGLVLDCYFFFSWKSVYGRSCLCHQSLLLLLWSFCHAYKWSTLDIFTLHFWTASKMLSKTIKFQTKIFEICETMLATKATKISGCPACVQNNEAFCWNSWTTVSQ